MRFNAKELAALAVQPSQKFDKEGVLLFKEKHDGFFKRSEAFVERWCRLRGNLLFLFRSKDQCSEPYGILLLERCTVELDLKEELPFSFIIIFEEDSRVHQLAAQSEAERDSWMEALQLASYECMRCQLVSLQEQVQARLSRLEASSSGQPSSSLASPQEAIAEPLFEMRWPTPNSLVKVSMMTPPELYWRPHGQTEVIDGSSNPFFLTTLAFDSASRVAMTTRVRLRIYDVRERMTDVMTLLGGATFTIAQYRQHGEQSRLRVRARVARRSPRRIRHRAGVAARELRGARMGPRAAAACALTDALHADVISRTFRFPSGLGAEISVREYMAESRLCFPVTCRLLQVRLAEEEEAMRRLESLGEMAAEWEVLREERLDHHKLLTNTYSQALAYMIKHEGPHFKRSIQKGERSLEFVPTNMHMQRMTIRNNTLSKVGCYDILTVGAFTAYSQRYKHGGLQRIIKHFKDACIKTSDNLSYNLSLSKVKKAKEILQNVVVMETAVMEAIDAIMAAVHSLSLDQLIDCAETLNQTTRELYVLCSFPILDEANQVLLSAQPPTEGAPPSVAAVSARVRTLSGGSEDALTPRRIRDCIRRISESSASAAGPPPVAPPAGEGAQSLPTSVSCLVAPLDRLDGGGDTDAVSNPSAASAGGATSDTDESSSKFSGEGGRPECSPAVSVGNAAGSPPVSAGDAAGSPAVSVGDAAGSPAVSVGDAAGSPAVSAGDTAGSASEIIAGKDESLVATVISGPPEVGRLASPDATALSSETSSSSRSSTEAPSTATTPSTPSVSTLSSPSRRADDDGSGDGPGDRLVSTPDTAGPNKCRVWTAAGRWSVEENQSWDLSRLNVEANLVCIVSKVDSLMRVSGGGGGGGGGGGAGGRTDEAVSWREELEPYIVKLHDAVSATCGKIRAGLTTLVLKEESSRNLTTAQTIQYRQDVVFTQAVTSLVVAFMTRVWCQPLDDAYCSQLVKLGVLAQFESLLSCYGDETGMLEDMVVAVQELRNVRFVLSSVETERCASYDVEPEISRHSAVLLVRIPVPKCVFVNLREELQHGHMIIVVPLLFSIGINENATLAERFGDTSLQEHINAENLEKLKGYWEKFKDLTTTPIHRRRSRHDSGNSVLLSLFNQLQTSVAQKTSKNVEILHLAAQVSRKMNGLRFTSCKSAKDRTAMSVTLEQCHILQHDFCVESQESSAVLDCMRSEGVRRKNTVKNTGCDKYAFNAFQMMTFPRAYRPPSGTFGSNVT
ncbi:PREDICTED: type I inositol 3,4-bisphosphate 4-phosphatase-like [Priapulus caudatus]|uniref:Type I inositol 3,4-bisphosphate 4-phosphatase-like n=1 Tax=Priapulus caudatus TaxID=37621 RepID=A0ABM1DT37_PRICU|nr:PREDICTED: type I inositol 3,4-bisphosphate 4-phosphatase-like [Priapulus caudatus]